MSRYRVRFHLFLRSFRYIPTGIAYAVWSGIGIILISLLAWWAHGQRLNLLYRPACFYSW
ncbi:SMR family transporter [Pseudomonas japonica]|uniref:SMR family transporter n=1 Tax=Pseudomonas japonica TaxID=256466 RepID=UPI0035BED1B7